MIPRLAKKFCGDVEAGNCGNPGPMPSLTGSSRLGSGKNPGGGSGGKDRLESSSEAKPFPGPFISKVFSSSSTVMALPRGGRSILSVSGSGLEFETGSNLPIPASRDKK